MGKLQGKVALVTGASKGIGAAIAKAYAAEGATVVVNYASDRAGAEAVVSDIERGQGRAIAVQADVAKSGDVERLFDISKETFGRVDVVVNNAGVFAFQPLEQVSEAEFHRQFNINVLGSLLVAQQAAKHIGADGGSIVNVSSVVSESPVPGSSIYSATKGAVDTLSVALALELAPRKIRVNTVAPGGVDTEGARTLGIPDSDFGADIIARTPLGRLGRPDDIAKVAVFLASDDSAWLTGERITASGGLH
ncbi:MAG: glucose 1-dehydrogenase [Alphaproteobacteria bacterium]|nr:glucose 1-dehydrogenase [Alphaproteobacteria bacterium]